MNIENGRVPTVPVSPIFTDRWSPRSFTSDPIPYEHIMSLFEASRWAPSCFNGQPWHFLYAIEPHERARFLDLLVEKNRSWAKRVPLLAFVLCKRNFSHNGAENRHAAFDAGAAWMSLALQARELGLYAHGMAGFHYDDAFEVLQVPREEFDIMAAVAVGYRDTGSDDSIKNSQPLEEPNGREPLVNMIQEGVFRLKE